nr:hypothetical protein [Butyrivibrio sp. WCD3002]
MERWMETDQNGTDTYDGRNDGDAGQISVALPHDAMIHEDRDESTKNQHQTGYYPGCVYQYCKTFFAPAEWENRKVIIEFEGVYQHAQVYVLNAIKTI